MKQMMARTETNRERDRDDLKGIMAKMIAKMDAQHKMMMAILDAYHERTMASLGETEAKDFKAMDAQHKMMMAILDAYHERTMASLGETEAKDFKAIPEEMETVTEHQEIPKEDATVMPVGEPRKRRRVCNQPENEGKDPEKTDSRGSWLPPAGRCPAVQKWRGEKGTFSGMFRPKKTVDCERY
jgi:hypothetical protein